MTTPKLAYRPSTIYWLNAILFCLSSCSTECPEVDLSTVSGQNISISLFECGSTDSVFTITLTSLFAEKFQLDGHQQSTRNADEKYYDIPEEQIFLSKNVDFDYEVDIFKFDSTRFSLYIHVSKFDFRKGKNVTIRGVNLYVDSVGDSVTTLPEYGWSSCFMFDGRIARKDDGRTEILIRPIDSQFEGLHFFNGGNNLMSDFYQPYSLAVTSFSMKRKNETKIANH